MHRKKGEEERNRTTGTSQTYETMDASDAAKERELLSFNIQIENFSTFSFFLALLPLCVKSVV